MRGEPEFDGVGCLLALLGLFLGVMLLWGVLWLLGFVVQTLWGWLT